MQYAVLIVEDDPDLSRNLCDFLDMRGYATDHAADGHSALHLIRSNAYDLVVLDISLPGIDGMALCKRIRAEMRSTLPIVMLTARNEIDTKISAFDLGADDYVVKPAALREIEARIRALIRRATREILDGEVLQVGDLTLDTGTMQVERRGSPITLPPVALKILLLLMRRAPNVVHRTTLQREVWGDELDDSHALIVHMHTLRAAIDKPFGQQLIHTVRGFGYRITDAE